MPQNCCCMPHFGGKNAVVACYDIMVFVDFAHIPMPHVFTSILFAYFFFRKHKLCIIFFVFWDEAKKMRSVQRAKMLLLFVILLVSHSCMKHDDMHWCLWSDQHDKNHWHIFGFKGCLHSIYCITQTEELDFIFTPMGSTQYARNCATLQLRIDCNANSIRWQQV